MGSFPCLKLPPTLPKTERKTHPNKCLSDGVVGKVPGRFDPGAAFVAEVELLFVELNSSPRPVCASPITPCANPEYFQRVLRPT